MEYKEPKEKIITGDTDEHSVYEVKKAIKGLNVKRFCFTDKDEKDLQNVINDKEQQS
jgi:hypothetical protein